MSPYEAEKRIIPWISKKKILEIGRVADMVWIIFGGSEDTSCCMDTRGNKEYSLHIQCTFRLLKNGEILLGNTDIYCAGEGESEIISSYTAGMSLFDQRAKYFNSLLPLTVTGINVAENGDIRISLQDSFLLEVLVAGAMPREFWRVFQRGDLNSHVVYESESIV